VPDFDAEAVECESVALAARADEVVDAVERMGAALLNPPTQQRRTHEAAGTGDKNSHNEALARLRLRTYAT
jgi:hypothetical protein